MRNSGTLSNTVLFIDRVVPDPQRKQITFTYFMCKLVQTIKFIVFEYLNSFHQYTVPNGT